VLKLIHKAAEIAAKKDKLKNIAQNGTD